MRRLDGSTESTATLLSSKSRRKRRTNSSVRQLLPAPPVPVIPRMGCAFSGRPVRNVEDLRAVVKDSQDLVALLVQRGSSRIFVPVELA